MVGVRVGDEHRRDGLRGAADGREGGEERLAVAGVAGVDQRDRVAVA